MQALEQVTGKMWPGVPIVSTMADGASDGIYTNAAGMPLLQVAGIGAGRATMCALTEKMSACPSLRTIAASISTTAF